MVMSSWSSEELEAWRSSLSEIASEAGGLSGDPMLAEYIAEQESAKSMSEEWSESVDPDFSDAMDAYASMPVGPWDTDPGWSPWASEEEESERLSDLDEWAKSMSDESAGGLSGRSGGLGGAVGALDDMEGRAPVVAVSGAENGPGEVVVVPAMSEAAAERAASFRRWSEGSERLSSESSSAVYDDYGDRVDEDGREARGLVRVPGSQGDGRAYWWFFSVWAKYLSVESWSESFEAAGVEGLAILHNQDRVDEHLHGVVRRSGGRLKGSEKQIRRAVADWLGCPLSAVSLSPVLDTRAAVAYLTHESVPGGAGKHRYDRSEIVEAGGVRLEDWSAERGSDWVAVVDDMQTCIDSMLASGQRVTLQGFISWCHVEAPDWWRVLVVKRSARLFLKDYLRA